MRLTAAQPGPWLRLATGPAKKPGRHKGPTAGGRRASIGRGGEPTTAKQTTEKKEAQPPQKGARRPRKNAQYRAGRNTDPPLPSLGFVIILPVFSPVPSFLGRHIAVCPHSLRRGGDPFACLRGLLSPRGPSFCFIWWLVRCGLDLGCALPAVLCPWSCVLLSLVRGLSLAVMALCRYVKLRVVYSRQCCLSARRLSFQLFPIAKETGLVLSSPAARSCSSLHLV